MTSTTNERTGDLPWRDAPWQPREGYPLHIRARLTRRAAGLNWSDDDELGLVGEYPEFRKPGWVHWRETIPAGVIPDLGDTRPGPDALTPTLDAIDILEAYRRWGGKDFEPKVGSKTESIMIRCPDPAHVDEHPSAWVNTDKQVYKCAVCDCGGDKYDIAAHHFGFAVPGYKTDGSFPELRRRMAADFGATVPAPGVAVCPEALASPASKPERVTSSPGWPELNSDALVGLAGDVVRVIDPATESSLVAVLTQFLVAFGNVVGRHAFSVAEADQHYGNLYVILVGETSKGRKGSSWSQVKRLFRSVDEDWVSNRIMGGASSSEGLIYQVRDEAWTLVRKKGAPAELELTDAGEADKRLLDYEPEFAQVLKVAAREGNTLSVLFRQAWDEGNLRTLTRTSPLRATGAHVSHVGHTTRDEVRRLLSETEAANGFGNRFLWIATRRSKQLPEGGSVDTAAMADLQDRVRAAVTHASGSGLVTRSEPAKRLWAANYERLSEGRPGLLGSITGRAEAQVLRLSMLYALLDHSSEVEPTHLRAALSVWDYADQSAAWIFGDSLGDPLADRVLDALRVARATGLTTTEVRDLLKRHGNATRVLQGLQEKALVVRAEESTSGRTSHRWIAVEHAKAAMAAGLRLT